MTRIEAVASILVLATAAQAQDGRAAQFEVASIKASKDPAPGGNVEITAGRFRGKDLALQWLILTAYRIRSSNLSGNLPGWTLSERYDIDAKTEDAAGEDRILTALQNLLNDRFQLKEHRETKQDLPNEYGQFGRGDGLVRTLDWRRVSLSAPAGVAYRSLAWLEEQLGLKLESGRGPVEYLVVDQFERPSGN